MFCAASGMEVIITKSCFTKHKVDMNIQDQILTFMHFQVSYMVEGFKYLGYYLKPTGYRIKDGFGLVENFEKRIVHWPYKLLSLGGKLTLLKSTLVGITAYSFPLAQFQRPFLE